MKKSLIIFTIVALILVSVVTASAVDHYDIQIHKDGEGAATFFYDYNKQTVSLGCEETSEKFIYWDIRGDYDIIKTEKEGKIYIIEPHSDLDITAVFESALYTDYDETTLSYISPQTGDNRLYPLILTFLLGITAGAFAIWKITRKD